MAATGRGDAVNTWMSCLAAVLIAGSIFVATAPQREWARRELERQDAAQAIQNQSEKAIQDRRARQMTDLMEQARANAGSD